MRGFFRVVILSALFFGGCLPLPQNAEPTALATESVEQIRTKAEQGDATAQFDLGVMYRRGQGVQQDYSQAYMWINLAATQGLEKSIKVQDALVKKLTPSQIEEGQRLAREWIAEHPQTLK
jgi:TPR repeat protein